MDAQFRIPGYEFIDAISDRGSQAIVYRARQVSIDHRQVAIKVYRSRLRAEDERLRFLREVAAMRELTGHRNVVRLDRADVVDGWAFIVMELCERSLDDQVRAHGPLPPDQVVDIALRVCRALTAAHTRGILHRDLKPSNLLWTDFGELVIADFGIAALDGAGNGPSTADASGTPGYIAPELLSGHPPTIQSDIYALGATLHTLLYGTTPAPGDRIMDPLVPKALAQAVSVALSANPASRFGSAREFATLIRAPETEASTRAGPVTVVDPTTVAACDDLAEGWLGTVDRARAPELRPPVVVPTPSTRPPQVGWWSAILSATLSLLLGLLVARSQLIYILGCALAVLGAHPLLRARGRSLRKLATTVLTCGIVALLAVATYFVTADRGQPVPASLAGVGAAVLLVAGAAQKITLSQRMRARQRQRELLECWAVADLANQAFEGSGRAPSWLTRLLALPAMRLYRLDDGPFEYAAACGSRVVVFAVVQWHQGQYTTLRSSPYVTRTGQPYRQGGSDMYAVVNGLHRLGPRLATPDGPMAFVVITRDGATGTGVQTVDSDALPGLSLSTPETVTHRAGQYLAADPYHIDIPLTRRLLRLLDQ